MIDPQITRCPKCKCPLDWTRMRKSKPKSGKGEYYHCRCGNLSYSPGNRQYNLRNKFVLQALLPLIVV